MMYAQTKGETRPAGQAAIAQSLVLSSRNWSRQYWPEILILSLAILLRIWHLSLRPPHFDEGINGWFADQMKAIGYYRYDPANFHGPLHFYAIFLAQTLFGRSLWVLRLPTVIMSVCSVAAMLRFRHYFGQTAARMAALFMAISPGFVFYGRYAIHETWQVFFCILLLLGIMGIWTSGKRQDLWLIASGITGMILTKETWILHLGCFLLAAPVWWLWNHWFPSRPPAPRSPRHWSKRDVIVSIAVAAAVIIYFYSGTFLDFPALHGLYQTFAIWFETGMDTDKHAKTAYDLFWILNYYWIALAARYEWPMLLGLLAGIRYLWPSDARIRYVAIAACGTLVAYSIIPYKTPWCITSIAWLFYLLLGTTMQEAAARWGKPVWTIPGTLACVSIAMCAHLNFRAYTDDREPYVYVQTLPEIYRFTNPILEHARMDPMGYHVKGGIFLDSYYPLPWILGDFPNIGYYTDENAMHETHFDFIVIPASEEPHFEQHFKQAYFKIPFLLRSGMPGVTAYLSVDRYACVFAQQKEKPMILEK
jgi:uncharacterized protein (TIGR03663 family)